MWATLGSWRGIAWGSSATHPSVDYAGPAAIRWRDWWETWGSGSAWIGRRGLAFGVTRGASARGLAHFLAPGGWPIRSQRDGRWWAS